MMGKPNFWSHPMREPTPDQIVGGIAEHMAEYLLPLAAIGAEVWRALMEKFIADVERMRAADLDLMADRPERLDTRADRAALYERVRARTADLRDDFNRAVDLPRGWFSWSPAAKRRRLAIDKAGATEREWSTSGSVRFLQGEAAKLERAVRRQDKRIRDFDSRPEVQAASRRLDDYPGAIRMCEGLAELKPDKELHAALSPMVGRDGGILRINAAAGLELLRRRTAIAAATRGAAAGKGGVRQEQTAVPEMDGPEVEVPEDDRPDLDDMGPVAGLLM